MKYILYIGDGMADNPVPELGDVTPLEYANIPYIDSLARKSEVGTVRNVPSGFPAGSDTAILTILGNDIKKSYSGRGPLEAAAVNIFPEPGATAYRCNLVAIEDSDKPFFERKILSHSAGSVEAEDAIEAVEELLSNQEFCALLKINGMTIHKSPNFRQMAVQSNADNSGLVLIPPHDHLGEPVGGLMPTGCENAKVLSDIIIKSFEILNDLPVNIKRRKAGKLPANSLWFWADGTSMQLENFEDKFGKKPAVVSAVPLVQGISKLMGMDVYLVDGATGEIDSNLEGKVETAISLIDKYDFLLLHVEAPDECTHNGDLKGKLQTIEWLETRVLKPFMNYIEDNGIDIRLLFLSDHKTLTSTRGHDGDPVPYMIYDSTKTVVGPECFTEKSAAQGPFIESGITLMNRLFEI